VRDLVRVYRRAVDCILECDHPDLTPFAPELERLRARWSTERVKRDNRLLQQAVRSSLHGIAATEQLNPSCSAEAA